MSMFAPAPPPPSVLGRYRVLSKLASVFVSPICLGAGSIGDQWHKFGVTHMDKESSFKLLDAYYEAGGNFIDTANNYQDETSELFIGEWMEVRGIRDQMVIATKFSNNYKSADKNIPAHARINYTGNSAKSMHISVRDSLKKLRTDYIDLLYVHWWSFDTSIVELMNSLHDLVVAKKVLYLGASDTPAWIVAQANQYALDHGKTPFSVYQGSWNVMDRSFERDIIPMARQWGMALCPWNVLVGGKLRSDAEEERRRKSEKGRDLLGGGWERTPEEKTMVHALEKVANEIGSGVSLTAVAIAYVMQKTPYVVPIIGGRKAEHLMENAKALEISLSPEQIAFIEGVVPFDPGFPHTMIGNGLTPPLFYGISGTVDFVKPVDAIRPSPSHNK